jgi:hypothetical protein
MARVRSGESDNTRSVRQRLRDKHGLNTSRNSALPEDEGLDSRARFGLFRENGSTYGIPHAHGAIRNRFLGDMAGRKDDR